MRVAYISYTDWWQVFYQPDSWSGSPKLGNQRHDVLYAWQTQFTKTSGLDLPLDLGENPIVEDGIIYQSSACATALNDFDVQGHGPQLSTGLYEKPVHHIRGIMSVPCGEEEPFSYSTGELTSLRSGRLCYSSVYHPPGRWGAWYSWLALASEWNYATRTLEVHYGMTNPWDDPSFVSVLTLGEVSGDTVSYTLTIVRFYDQMTVHSSEGALRISYLDGEAFGLDSKEEFREFLSLHDSVCRPSQSLYYRAYESVAKKLQDLQVNNLENFASLVQTSKLFKLASWLPGGRSAIKWLSGVFLAWSYGVKPTIGDVKTIIEYYNRYAVFNRYVGYTTIREDGVKWNFKFDISKTPSEIDRAFSLARDAGLKLSASNLWDLVPYSFVVDWIIPIGDLLSRAEAYSELSERWTFNYASVSFTVEKTELFHGLPVEIRVYDRHILDSPPSPLGAWDNAGGIPILNAGALLINLLT